MSEETQRAGVICSGCKLTPVAYRGAEIVGYICEQHRIVYSKSQLNGNFIVGAPHDEPFKNLTAPPINHLDLRGWWLTKNWSFVYFDGTKEGELWVGMLVDYEGMPLQRLKYFDLDFRSDPGLNLAVRKRGEEVYVHGVNKPVEWPILKTK